MIGLTRNKLREITGGSCVESAQKLNFLGVEYDSRLVRGGELFVALKGENTHGHTFLKGAFDKGAALALVEDRALLDSHPERERLVWVPDTLRAFSELASWWRQELATPIAAITGSVGKTTVKEMCAAILLAHSRGNYSQKSYNNHVGVPYTLCKFSPEHRWGVVEMGMNHAGEIEALTKIARPDIAAITAIAPAHIQNFGSIDGIVDAKLEIRLGLSPGAWLILNGESADLKRGRERHDLSAYKIASFGSAAGSDALVQKISSRGLEGISFELSLDGAREEIQMAVLGAHNAYNAAAAALIAKRLVPELALAQIALALRRFQAPLMRLNVKYLGSGRTVIDDSYNANLASMRSALAIVKDLVSAGSKVALLLGDMKELGAESKRLHAELAEDVIRCGALSVVCVGEESRAIYERALGAKLAAFHADSPEAAAQIVRKLPFQILLVKASRGIELDRAVKALVEAEGEVIPKPLSLD